MSIDNSSHGGLAEGSLTGRVALVTGAGGGIGRSVALTLGQLGAAVGVVDIDEVAATATCNELEATGCAAVSVAADIGQHELLAGVVSQITDRLGPVSILVNNAGIAITFSLMDTDLSVWERTIAVNLTAAFVLTKEIGTRMVASGRGGSIVNLSSSAAFRAVNAAGAYGVTKAALGALTRGAASELGLHGVNVNAVAPGVTRTKLTIDGLGGEAALDEAVRGGVLENLLHRVSEPEDVANVVAFLCLPASRQITGQVIQVSAGSVVAAG